MTKARNQGHYLQQGSGRKSFRSRDLKRTKPSLTRHRTDRSFDPAVLC